MQLYHTLFLIGCGVLFHLGPVSPILCGCLCEPATGSIWQVCYKNVARFNSFVKSFPLSCLFAECSDWQCLAKNMAANQAELFTLEQEIASLNKELKQVNQNQAHLEEEMAAIKAQIAAHHSPNQPRNQISHYQQNKIHDECHNYKTLNYHGRAITNRPKSYKASRTDIYGSPIANPDWKGRNRYRFTGPFTRMAVKGEVHNNMQCGCWGAPGYIADPKAHEMKIGEMKEFVNVCFHGMKGTPCGISKSITITRCPGDYFVYRLPDMLGSGGVYCGAK